MVHGQSRRGPYLIQIRARKRKTTVATVPAIISTIQIPEVKLLSGMTLCLTPIAIPMLTVINAPKQTRVIATSRTGLRLPTFAIAVIYGFLRSAGGLFEKMEKDTIV